jgi:hypothetical protein
MNKTYALIKNNEVINTALWDGKTEWNPECDEIIEITESNNIGIGWIRRNNEWINPNLNEGNNLEISIEQKLQMAGISIDELKTALGL